MLKNWSNTTLVAYSSLQKIEKSLDFSFFRLVKSGFQSVHLKNGVSTERLIGEMIKINDEKIKISNLRFIVSTTLEQMSLMGKSLILDKIFRKKTFAEIADEYHLSLRTTYRRFESALEEYAHKLKAAGYTESWFEQEYSGVKTIAIIKAQFEEDKYLIAKNI